MRERLHAVAADIQDTANTCDSYQKKKVVSKSLLYAKKRTFITTASSKSQSDKEQKLGEQA